MSSLTTTDFDTADLARVGAPFEVQDSRSQLDQTFSSHLPDQELEEALRLHINSLIKAEVQLLRDSIHHTARFEQVWVKLMPTFSPRRKRPRLCRGTQEVVEPLDTPVMDDDSLPSYTAVSHLGSNDLIQPDLASGTDHPNGFVYDQNAGIYDETMAPPDLSPPSVYTNGSALYNQPAMFGTTQYQWTGSSNSLPPSTYPSMTGHEPLGVPNDAYLSPIEDYNLSPVHPKLSSPELQSPVQTILDKHSLSKEGHGKYRPDTTLHQPQASHGTFSQYDDPLDPRSIPWFAEPIPGGDVGLLLQDDPI